MRIIKLNAIDSTNSFLRQLSSTENLEDFTVVVTKHQTSGRGQMGTHWHSQESKNLMVSIFKDVSYLSVEQHFYISMVVSLAVSKTLQEFKINSLKIKWPNDILAEQQKISGILIENVIKQNQLQSSIIGFGLNVNQTIFNNLPNATSMQLLSGIHYDLDEVLQKVLTYLDYYFSILETKKFNIIKKEYETKLFRKDKPSTFKDAEGVLFSGYIKGVTVTGHLLVLVQDGVVKTFDLKEVTLLY